MSDTVAPLVAFSVDDHGAVVIVFITAACCFSVLFAIARLAVAVHRTLDFQPDDFLIHVSLVIAITQTALLAQAQNAGLGRHLSSLSAVHITRYFKFTYSAEILAVIAMAFAKASVVYLFQRLNIYRAKTGPLLILLSSIGAWCLLSVFIIAFQCHLPEPWRMSPSNCPSHGKLYFVVGSLNIFTDAILSLYIIPEISKLNMSIGLRFTVIALFASRLIICALSIFDLVLLARLPNSTDVTWDSVPRAILQNVIMHVSLITATIPRIHGFIATFQSGQIGTHVPERAYRLSQKPQPGFKPYESEGSSKESSKSDGRSWDYPLKFIPIHRVAHIVQSYRNRHGSNSSNSSKSKTPPKESLA